MEITFTEITSNQGPIAKQLKIHPDGKIEKLSDTGAKIYDATGKTMKVKAENFKEYLEELNHDPLKAIMPGIWKEAQGEYRIVTQGKEDPSQGIIYRGKEYFSFCNSDQVGLTFLDIDGDWPEEVIDEFLTYLNDVLKDSFINSDVDHTQFMYWSKLSSGAAAVEKGKVKTNRHIYIPTKNPKKELTEEIFKLAWLKFPKHRVNNGVNAGISLRSLIDVATKGPERFVYESNPTITGDLSLVDTNERECYFMPGAAIDSELALCILHEATASYDSAVSAYKSAITSSDAYIAEKQSRVKDEIEKNKKAGMSSGQARARAMARSEGVLFSDEFIPRSDLNQPPVSVLDILLDQDSWMDQTQFNDPEDPEQGRNVGKLMRWEDGRIVLWSKKHGEMPYFLRFTPEHLSNFVKTHSAEEVEENLAEFTALCDLSPFQIENLAKDAAVTIGVTKTTSKKVVNAGVKTNEKIKQKDKEETTYGEISDKASHFEISRYYISKQNECVGFGNGLYVWNNGTIWEKQSESRIMSYVGERCKGKFCSTRSQYSQIAKMIVEDPNIVTENWHQEYGFPCSDGFYKINVEGKSIDKVPYTKELGCRFKMKISPSPMPTPMFDKILANVESPVLYQQLFGLMVSGYLQELQKVAIFFGDGGSGKGTSERILSALLPGNRITKIGLDTMNKPEGRIALTDSVINIISELKRGPSGYSLSLEGLKMITGGDAVSARRLYSDHGMTFKPKCCHLIEINDWPRLEASSGSEVKRRLGDTIVRFVRKNTEQITGLSDMIIKNELPGILMWAMEGVRIYLENGLQDGEASEKMYSRWVSSFSPTQQFIAERCEYAPGFKEVRANFWRAFREFCISSGICNSAAEFKESQADFYQFLEKDGRVKVKRENSSGMCLLGIRLAEETSPVPASHK